MTEAEYKTIREQLKVAIDVLLEVTDHVSLHSDTKEQRLAGCHMVAAMGALSAAAVLLGVE